MEQIKPSDVNNWCRFGRILYANLNIDGDFLYGQGFAKKLFWRIYILKGREI